MKPKSIVWLQRILFFICSVLIGVTIFLHARSMIEIEPTHCPQPPLPGHGFMVCIDLPYFSWAFFRNLVLILGLAPMALLLFSTLWPSKFFSWVSVGLFSFVYIALCSVLIWVGIEDSGYEDPWIVLGYF